MTIRSRIALALSPGEFRQMKGSRDSRRGQALIETALTLPVVLAMIWGIMGLGRLYTAQLAISNATREGARLGAVGKSPSRIDQGVREYLSGAGLSRAVSVAIKGAGGHPGDQVQVAVTVQMLNPVPVPGLPANLPLSASCTMRIE